MSPRLRRALLDLSLSTLHVVAIGGDIVHVVCHHLETCEGKHATSTSGHLTRAGAPLHTWVHACELDMRGQSETASVYSLFVVCCNRRTFRGKLLEDDLDGVAVGVHAGVRPRQPGVQLLPAVHHLDPVLLEALHAPVRGRTHARRSLNLAHERAHLSGGGSGWRA